MSVIPARQGFTIVELLIVIVVIAILAAVSVVAYNGVQQRANNDKTTAALAAWIKAMNLYKVDKGHWPNEGFIRVCLGSGYLYELSGTETSGTAQCRLTATTGFLENATFNASMQPYLGNTIPTPAFITARFSDTEWRRGLSYYFGGGSGTDVYIEAAYQGDVNPCPSAAGKQAGSRSLWGTNTYCYYNLGLTTDT